MEKRKNRIALLPIYSWGILEKRQREAYIATMLESNATHGHAAHPRLPAQDPSVSTATSQL